MNNKQNTPLLYLFLTFLKIGAISWGGFMALISVVQKQLVEKDKKLSDEVILDGISLASVLPGPIAFNVIAYIGYYLKGIKGALISMIAILLPSFLLITALSYVYIVYGQLPAFSNFFMGVLPAVAAIIISVAINMTRKNIKDFKQVIILLISGSMLIFLHSFYTTIIIMILGALAGFIFYRNSTCESVKKPPKNHTFRIQHVITAIVIFASLLLVIWLLPYFSNENILKQNQITRDLSLTFSGMSLTLFGGGYVVIPAMHKVVVEGLQWLNTKEFTDAIALGQITPGPIFISATFIGYKVGGFIGAIVATISIFFPPALFMIFCSHFLIRIKQSKIITSIFKGLRPAVIGMIFAAAYTIGTGVEFKWPTLLIFAGVLVLSVKFKVNVVYLIPVSGIAGLLLFSIF